MQTDLVAWREKILADLEGGNEPYTALVLVHHRKSAKAVLTDAGKCLVDRFLRSDAHHVRIHNILDSRPDAGQEPRRFEAKLCQRVVDPLVGIPTTRGPYFVRASRLLEFRISNRGTNRIHVRVLVTNDDSLHAFLVACTRFWQ